jgi:hypothetical protein
MRLLEAGGWKLFSRAETENFKYDQYLLCSKKYKPKKQGRLSYGEK